MAQPGDVVITTKEMYDEVRATHDAVKEIRGEMKTLREEVKAQSADHETRIRALERRVWVATGGGGALGAIAGALITAFTGG
ncbi:hypothetical protein [Amycolatopsis viridis]|uniref:ElaB/YqjD/DUF883 family membrane-anchored ribosome-binding protein n=1 Tax=Amycolatopsis viridis TaxID=185678 RepID=A0ABX0T2A4_9PSEU|nr:hypothetical protein [Amycolatopsis viridis]NIH81681.1 ElaB/YqjD/DUF883 family membrane-anchored ribosome-binding protein [Amycolatopsis viridis]